MARSGRGDRIVSRGARLVATASMLFILLASSVGADATVGSDDWPQFHYDAAHTGYNRNEVILSASSVGVLEQKWTLVLGGDRIERSPTVASGLVYTSRGSGGAWIWSIDETAGQWGSMNTGRSAVAAVVLGTGCG